MSEMVTQEVHNLRYALLETRKRMGEILALVKTTGELDEFITRHCIPADDAEMLITLHSDWEYVQAAIEWCERQGLPLPASAEEALRLLGPWKRSQIN